MSTYTKQGFNNTTIKMLRDDIDSLLAKYNINEGATLGLELSAGNCTYEDGEATMQLKINIDGMQTREQKAVEMFTDFKYGDMVRDRRSSKIFTIVGYKTRSPKKPLIIRDLGGNEYKATDSFLTNVDSLVEGE